MKLWINVLFMKCERLRLLDIKLCLHGLRLSLALISLDQCLLLTLLCSHSKVFWVCLPLHVWAEDVCDLDWHVRTHAPQHISSCS